MRGSFHHFTTAEPRRVTRRLGAAVAAMLWLVAAPVLAAGAELTDVRIGVHKDFTRVVLQTDAAVHPRVHQSADEIRIHLDATSQPRAVTAKSHLLTWVKVKPAAGGSDVQIQLRGPATLKQMVLHKPDRLVLDVYPARHAAATPAPPKAAPTAKAPPPAPVPEATAPAGAAETGATAQAEPSTAPGTTAPSAAQAPAPSQAPTPGVGAPGEAAGAPAQPGTAEGTAEEGAAPAPPAEAQAPTVPRPIPPPHPGKPMSRGLLDFLPPPFDQPITLGLIAFLLLALFVLLRVRRQRVARADLSPFPPEEEVVGEAEEVAPEQDSPLFAAQELAPPARPEPPGPVTVPPPGPPPRPAAPPPAGPSAAGAPAAAGPQGELERRVAHLEGRLEELLDSKERLERQVVAQTEELRVQRAAIARTQRVLRTIARPEDEATEPAPKT